MKQKIIDRCCNESSHAIIEYDLGSLGTRKFKVCAKHINIEPWNKHIISQTRLGDSND